jgi:thiol peroxidase
MSTITFQGSPLHLDGTLPAVGQKAPDFTLLANDLSPRGLKDFSGKALVIAAVPSLDTPVCDTEIRRFNKEVAALSDKLRILAVSCDLPFAQGRWCGAAGISAVQSLSDHRDVSFGKNYGVLIKELRLLARAVFIIDAQGVLRYVQIVPEMTNEPDYDAALAAAKAAV